MSAIVIRMVISSDEICLITGAAVGIAGGGLDLFASRRIPNWLTYPSVIAGLTMHLVLGGWRGLLSSLGAAAIVFLLMLGFFALNTMAAGDLKLMTAVAAFAALPHVFQVMFWTAIIGGIMALGFIAWKGQLRKRTTNVWMLVMHHFHSGLVPNPELSLDNPDALLMPYGPAIAMGAVVVLFIAKRWAA